jgi:5S rRNA maturation endonuclease (ribonuclease M5)
MLNFQLHEFLEKLKKSKKLIIVEGNKDKEVLKKLDLKKFMLFLEKP